MVINRLKLVFEQNQERNPLFLRSLLKQELQLFVLNFVYNSSYLEKFIFKGGTCLRLCFDLPRLSEDLDFDVADFSNFSFKRFSHDLALYFAKSLKYKNFRIRISGKNKIIYLQFPVLKEIGFPVMTEKPSENLLFLRIDLASLRGKFFQKEVSLKSTADFSLLLRRYSLPDLFAGKIAAILGREVFAGKDFRPRFKGRDYFDYFWFLEKRVEPNYPYLFSFSGIGSVREVKARLKERIKEALKRKEEIKKDLLPFFENPLFIEDFVRNLEKMRENYLLN